MQEIISKEEVHSTAINLAFVEFDVLCFFHAQSCLSHMAPHAALLLLWLTVINRDAVALHETVMTRRIGSMCKPCTWSTSACFMKLQSDRLAPQKLSQWSSITPYLELAHTMPSYSSIVAVQKSCPPPSRRVENSAGCVQITWQADASWHVEATFKGQKQTTQQTAQHYLP